MMIETELKKFVAIVEGKYQTPLSEAQKRACRSAYYAGANALYCAIARCDSAALVHEVMQDFQAELNEVLQRLRETGEQK